MEKQDARTKEESRQESRRQKTRRFMLVLMLAMATLAMHAVLTGATPRSIEGAPSTAAPPQNGVDFLLPPPAAPATGAKAPSSSDRTTPFTETTPLTDTTPMGTAPPGDSGPVRVEAHLDRQSVLVGSDGRLYAEVVLEGAPSEVKERQPTDLIVVLDHSSSMSGQKMAQARQATIDLISRLDESDTFALVAFSSSSRVVIERTRATLNARRHWQSLVAGIQSGGSTHMLGGLDDALGVLRRRGGDSERPCRVLLLSDGHPNSTEGLESRARMASHFGAALSSLGVGADFNETLMGHLADLGTGNYYFLDRPQTIATVFAGELEAGRSTIASDVQLAFTPGPGISLIEAAGYPLERQAGATLVRPGHIFAGQTRRLWLTFEVDAAQPFDDRPLGQLDMSWQSGGESFHRDLSAPLKVACVTEREKYLAGIDADAWGRAVISEEYGRLQNQVADHIRGGREEEAKSIIERYVTRQSTQNAYVQNSDVSSNLAKIEELRQEVDDAFSGANQVEKQKLLSKQKHMVSQQLRRLAEGDG